jgi:prepilin peptidase CpaA
MIPIVRCLPAWFAVAWDAMPAARTGIWTLAALLAAAAGWTDWRSRRIPNWLTVPALLLGIAVNAIFGRWAGAKDSLLGLALGLGVMLPFVLVRALGAGDLKLVSALGAILGPGRLLAVLFVAVLVAGVMAVILIIWKKRVRQTGRNILRILASLFSFHMPQPDLTLENPQALKVPFGVAVAVAVLLYTAGQTWGIA